MKILQFWIIIALTACFSHPTKSQSLKQETRNQYVISDVQDIRQNIAPNGFNHFVTPLEKDSFCKLHETADYVFACYDTHLDVYIKKDQYWQVFTLSDGFHPVNSRFVELENYQNHLLIIDYESNKKEKRKMIMIFDKMELNIQSISETKLESLTKSWSSEEFEINQNDLWFLEKTHPPRIVHENKSTNQKSFYTYSYDGLNKIKQLNRSNRSLFIVQQNGIREIKPDGSFKLISSAQGLYNDKVKSISIFNDELLVVYDRAIDIFSISNFDLVKRYNFTEKISLATFTDKSLFYSTNHKLFVKNRGNESLEDSLILNSHITGLDYNEPRIIIETLTGFSSYNTKNQELNHFIKNKTITQSDQEIDYESGYDTEYYDSFNWLGKINNTLIGKTSENRYKTTSGAKSVIFYDLAADKMTGYEESVLYSKIQELIINSTNCFISQNQILVANGDKYALHKVSIEDHGITKIMEFNLGQKAENNFIPNAVQSKLNYPLGSKINIFQRFFNKNYFVTEKGLFSLNKINEWSSHFIASTRIYGSNLLVTAEDIYFYGEGNARSIGSWSKIDRNSFKTSHYLKSLWDAYPNSIKFKGSELIAATKNGVLIYNFETRNHSYITTPEPIGQVAFLGDNYLAANNHEIYEYNYSGVLVDIKSLKNRLVDDTFKPAPRTMDVDGSNIWLTSKSLGGTLSLLNIETNHQLDYHIPWSYSGGSKIFSDETHTWLFGSHAVFRYNKKKKTLFREGYIKHPQISRLLGIYGVSENDSLFYITSDQGVYELNKRTMKFRKSTFPAFSELKARSFYKYEDTYYFRVDDGAIQISQEQFESSFTEASPISLFKYNFPDGIVLPFSDDSITINSKDSDYLFHYNLKNEIEEHYLKIDPINPNKSFKIYLDDKELQLSHGWTNQGDPIQNIYKLPLVHSEFKSSCMNLSLFYINGGKEMLIKEWQVNVEDK